MGMPSMFLCMLMAAAVAVIVVVMCGFAVGMFTTMIVQRLCDSSRVAAVRVFGVRVFAVSMSRMIVGGFMPL